MYLVQQCNGTHTLFPVIFGLIFNLAIEKIKGMDTYHWQAVAVLLDNTTLNTEPGEGSCSK